MKDNVTIGITGPEHAVTSGHLVPNAAAWQIRWPAWAFGFVAGAVATIAAVIVVERIDAKPRRAGPPAISQPSIQTTGGRVPSRSGASRPSEISPPPPRMVGPSAGSSERPKTSPPPPGTRAGDRQPARIRQ